MSKEKQCECCHEWWYDSDVKENLCPNCYDYFKQLKQQLTEKDKEIERLKEYADYKFELPYGNVTILGKTIEDIQWLTNAWLKQGNNQLAIQELEKVKDWLNEPFDEDGCFKIGGDLIDFIDQQINDLRGTKDVED